MRPISNGLRLVLMIIGAGRILAPVPCTLAASPSENCEQLAQLEIPGASVLAAHLIGQGTFKPPNGTEVPIAKASCRVTATAHPSSDSVIKFEVWLPVDWNGRIWGVGNGNLAGQIVYRYLGGRLADGYAMVATDAGHETNSMDSTWAVGHPEKVVDFGYRAIHEAAVDAKRVVAAFYGSMPAYSYFEGCSDGGREALMEAQRYPSDYDGIIAGAPANDWTHLQIAQAQMQFLWLADTSHQIPVGKLPALESAVLQACDKLDGVEDGIIEDPRRCSVPRSAVVCRGPETDRCLTQPQFDTFKRLHDGPVLASGQRLFRGFALGSDGAWDGMHFTSGDEKSGSFRFANGFFRDFVFEDPKWDFHTFDADRDGKLADQKLASILNATDPDLSRFVVRGGKLILYQGWSDPVIPAFPTVDYYRRVRSTLGAKRTNESIRLFMAPGMEHCGSGPGPNRFGQYGIKGGDPALHVGAALQRWVELGIAPDRIIATKLKDDADPASGVIRTRPLCAYPRVARYRGAGSTDDASNFDCTLTPEK
jgi:hypothetical protein